MAGADEVISQLQNIAVQLAAWVQCMSNATPAATTTTSPKFTAVTLGTASITPLVSTSSIRHGIVFHNPGTATCYVFQTGMATSPTTSTLGGSLSVAGGSTVPFPSAQYPNINCGFSGFAGTGTAQPFTIIEFF